MASASASASALAQQLKEQGNAAFKTGDFAKAAQLFTDAIDISPQEYILYSNRSGAYASLKKFADARTDALKCTQLAPVWAKGWVRLGVAVHGLGDFPAAQTAYAKALSLDADNLAAKAALQQLRGDGRVKADCVAAASPRKPATAAAAAAAGRAKRQLQTAEDASRARLVAELYAPGPLKTKNELVRRLNEFPASRDFQTTLDATAQTSELRLETRTTPFAFLCVRCDKAKISTLLARLDARRSPGKTIGEEAFVCHACYDHLVRCVLPWRDAPAGVARPETSCVHQVPRGYQKAYRNH